MINVQITMIGKMTNYLMIKIDYIFQILKQISFSILLLRSK